jgi:hypothetical protein
MWPDGARCAASFTFDFDAEEVWISEDSASAQSPGVLSQGTYGAKVAIPLILDLLARHQVQATFYTPGRVAERHPERVASIVAAGHELAHHGYTTTRRTSGLAGQPGPRPSAPQRTSGLCGRRSSLASGSSVEHACSRCTRRSSAARLGWPCSTGCWDSSPAILTSGWRRRRRSRAACEARSDLSADLTYRPI